MATLALNPLAGEFDPRLYRECRRSRGNRDLNAIRRDAEALYDKTVAFIEAHPAGCACPCCRFRAREAEDLLDDLRALAYALQVAAGFIGGAVITPTGGG